LRRGNVDDGPAKERGQVATAAQRSLEDIGEPTAKLRVGFLFLIDFEIGAAPGLAKPAAFNAEMSLVFVFGRYGLEVSQHWPSPFGNGSIPLAISYRLHAADSGSGVVVTSTNSMAAL
jgi:hypothetical protein